MVTMTAQTAPLSTPAETLARDAFTTLMWALSYPGRIYALPHPPADSAANTTFDSCLTIGATLLDLETSYFTPHSALAGALARTGARHASAATAAYHFYPEPYYFHRELAELDLPAANLAYLETAAVGTLLYPDQAATLIVACELGHGAQLHLSGPGIQGINSLRVAGLPPAFWNLRRQQLQYPLGWDLFLVDGAQVVGLPRTTEIGVIG